MENNYTKAILKYLSDNSAQKLKPRQLARKLGISADDYGTFRDAVKQLRDNGRIVLGSKNAITLPQMGLELVGYFRQNPRGFGFVIPEQPTAHGDLYIPAEDVGGAMTGDKVLAKVRKNRKRDGKNLYAGKIVQILERAKNQFVGELKRTDETFFVLPEGRKFSQPILIRDIGEAGPKVGTKVVVEIVDYSDGQSLPAGVIVEALGKPGKLAVETRGIIKAHDLLEEFPEDAMQVARNQVANFDPDNLDHQREDVTGLRIATIDPATARDFDDAISLTRHTDGSIELGVHIADVAHFVVEGSALDDHAKLRSTSVYFPRKVLPMLPEILSNGVCSLQEGQKRLAKSVFLTYDAQGNVVRTRLAETIIQSLKRLTYEQAQEICDGKQTDDAPEVIDLVKQMENLARKIEARRIENGMLNLDLPEVELVLDEDGRVIDAQKADDSYTHKIIEMFMVEANEAVARQLTQAGQNFLRRVHSQPDELTSKDLSAFIRACGLKAPASMSNKEIQKLLASVKDKPESYAVNLAVLKTFQQAVYSPDTVGHFALASEDYAHFTSPIRRYPDLMVHRLVAKLCRGQLDGTAVCDIASLTLRGEQCTEAERKASAAEDELKELLVLQLLETKVGEVFKGVITGVTNFGIFVQSPKYLREGLIRMEDLGDDWWEVETKLGRIRGEHTGKTYRLGDEIEVQIVDVDTIRRQLSLIPTEEEMVKPRRRRSRKKSTRQYKSSNKNARQSGSRKGSSNGSRKSTSKKSRSKKRR